MNRAQKTSSLLALKMLCASPRKENLMDTSRMRVQFLNWLLIETE